MKTLNGTITDKAEASWTGGEVTKANFKKWFDHWIKTGEDWHKELVAEELTLTAAKVLDLVEFNRKMGCSFGEPEPANNEAIFECSIEKQIEAYPQPSDEEDWQPPNYGDVGRILVRVIDDGEGFGKFSYEIIDHDGCTFWINEGIGFDWWLERECVFDRPGIYLIEGIVGHYHRGVWGFDDDDENWEFKSIKKIGWWARFKWWWRGIEGELE